MTIASETSRFISTIRSAIHSATAEPFQSFYDDTCERAYLAEKLILEVGMQMVQRQTAPELAETIRDLAAGREAISKAQFPRDVSPLADRMRTVARRIDVRARLASGAAAVGTAPAAAA
ncbi:MAG: hypothetical protein WKF57_06720 [Nakamurella sp.]